jgi:hypothetical protein
VGLDEDTAQEHFPHQPGAVEEGDPEAVGVIRIEDSSYLKNLVESMPWRNQNVIEWGGNITHY